MSLREKLNQEICEVFCWDLARSFTAKTLWSVNEDLDLAKIGVFMANNDADAIKNLIERKLLCQVDDATYKTWCQQSKNLNMLIISPFVLVQTKSL